MGFIMNKHNQKPTWMVKKFKKNAMVQRHFHCKIINFEPHILKAAIITSKKIKAWNVR